MGSVLAIGIILAWEKAVLVLGFLAVAFFLLQLAEAAGPVPVPEGLGARQKATTPFTPAGRYLEYLMLVMAAHGAHAPFRPFRVAGQVERGGVSSCFPL